MILTVAGGREYRKCWSEGKNLVSQKYIKILKMEVSNKWRKD